MEILFFIENKDLNKIKSILNSEKYFKIDNYYSQGHRHLPRMVKKNKLAAIEPHLKLINKVGYLNESNFIKNYKKTDEDIKIPNSKNLLLHNIYNQQINDYGYKYMNYSLRSFLDTKAIINKMDCKLSNFGLNKEFDNYILDMMEFDLIKNQKNIKLTNRRKAFRLIKKVKLIFNIYILFSNFIDFTLKIKTKIFLIIFDKNYRKHLNKKLKFSFFINEAGFPPKILIDSIEEATTDPARTTEPLLIVTPGLIIDPYATKHYPLC